MNKYLLISKITFAFTWLVGLANEVSAATITFGSGDKVGTTINSTIIYLQKFLMGVYIIVFLVGCTMLGSAKTRPLGIAAMTGTLVAVIATSLAPAIIKIFAGFTGMGGGTFTIQ